MPITTRSFTRLLVITVIVVLLPSCGSDDERPTSTDWSSEWAPIRDEVPDEPTFRAGGEELCGELLGDIRAHREVLLPSPSQAVDDLFEEWLGLAEGVLFDCPHDTDELDDRLDPVHDLAREIDDLTGSGQ